jgi:hypothetical protein
MIKDFMTRDNRLKNDLSSLHNRIKLDAFFCITYITIITIFLIVKINSFGV